jgi:hypothetical protein
VETWGRQIFLTVALVVLMSIAVGLLVYGLAHDDGGLAILGHRDPDALLGDSESRDAICLARQALRLCRFGCGPCGGHVGDL